MSERRRRRPWLAVLLAILISGLGHAYLRRWARAFGWYAAITATLLLFVPEPALNQLLARESPPLVDILPGLVVVAASVVDAYVLAVRNNRAYDKQAPTGAEAADSGDATASAAAIDASGDGSAHETPADVACPYCGRETDGSLDFCHWCTEPLGRAEGLVESGSGSGSGSGSRSESG